jgi:hypothetical protein
MEAEKRAMLITVGESLRTKRERVERGLRGCGACTVQRFETGCCGSCWDAWERTRQGVKVSSLVGHVTQLPANRLRRRALDVPVKHNIELLDHLLR